MNPSSSSDQKRKIVEGEGEEREVHPPSKLLISEAKPIRGTNSNLVFRCKTCNKNFPTYQSLDDHQVIDTNKHHNCVIYDLAPKNSRKSHECHICLNKFGSKQVLFRHKRIHREKDESSKGSSSKSSDVIHEEKSAGEGSSGDRSATVTRDFFPLGPMWFNVQPVEVVPVLERADSWLELKLAPLGGDFNKRRD